VPTLTRWFIKSAMLYLIVALILSVAMQSAVVGRLPLLRAIWPTYLHLLVVGWLTQLIFGVAFWMFPKHALRPPRGSEWLGWATFALLNAGLILRLIAEPLHGLGHRYPLLLVASAVTQLLAGWAFVANTWPRVRER
jgi:hypothetical protein